MSRCTISTAHTQREEMLDRAVAALQQNRNDDAVELCRQLIDQDPDDAEAWSFFGVGVARSDFERGLESLRKAVQLEPSNAQWHLNLGMSLFQAGQYQLAESACRKAVELSKGVVDALVPWADALSALGRYGEAADVLEQVVQAEDSTMNRRRLAFVQEVLGDNKAALATLAPVFQAMESQSTDVLQRGRLHMQLLQLEDAASEFRALEPHAAGLPEVALHIAAYRRTCGDFAGAQDILGAAWEENRYPPLMAALLDDVNVEASWLDEADTFVQSESTPLAERRAITFALARALDQAGQADEAWEMATRANSLYEDTASFDVNTYRAQLDAAAELMASTTTPDVYQGPGLVYLVGAPRTGARVLQSLLSAANDVAAVGERNSLLPWLRGILEQPEASRLDAMQSHGFQLRDADIHGLMNRMRGNTFIEVAPHYAQMLGLVHRIHPKARFIDARRDLRDVALSIFFHDLYPAFPGSRSPEDIVQFLLLHRQSVDRWIELGVPVSIHDQDAFAMDPQQAAAELFVQTGIDHDAALVASLEQRAMVDTFSPGEVREAITPDAIGRWQRYQRHVDQLFEPFQSLGYS